MEIVALNLKDKAIALNNGAFVEDADLFGRSAFNRFYYSAYLNTRKYLAPAFEGLPSKHAALPGFLRGTVSSEFKRRKQRALKADDHDAVKIAQDGKFAALELAELLVVGYKSRVTADYYPDVFLVFSAHSFTLNEVGLADAETWPRRSLFFGQADLYCDQANRCQVRI